MKAEDRLDAMLDQALEMTFPASDPFSIDVPEVEPDDAGALSAQQRELELAA